MSTMIDLHNLISKAGRYVIGSLVLFGFTIAALLCLKPIHSVRLDQLLEVPKPNLIFIHWYYWSQNVAGLALYYIDYIGYFAVLETC